MRIVTILILFFCLSCSSVDTEKETVFNKEKWKIMEGNDYPYRSEMLKDVVYNDTIRSLSKNEILELLGEPSYYREDKNYLYYTITRTRLLGWTLHTKVMVVKCSDLEAIEWIKIYE